MNRTLKEATVKTFHYETLASLMAHLQTFVMADNFVEAPQGAALANALSEPL